MEQTKTKEPSEGGGLTQGSMMKNLIRFSLPFLLSSFLQTFYGLADLFITGQFNGADTITAVSVGSQITHMITVVIVGLAMGTTVTVGRYVGAGKREEAARAIGNTVTVFAVFSVVLTVLTLALKAQIVAAVSTPPEAAEETGLYLVICFLGIPFITAYNCISSIYRGLGDSKTPMFFVAISGVINILLDYLFIGPMNMGAMGAALATVIAQGCSVLFALGAMKRAKWGIRLCAEDLKLRGNFAGVIFKIGVPVAAQDGFIQISFLVITAIANSRGVDVAAAVGIVEKLICFFFLVPSAMLSSVSAIAAQNAGAGQHDQSRRVLKYGVCISLGFGLLISLICQIGAYQMVGQFTKEEQVVRLGAQYLRSYIFDCALAGIHFCFSGYFCAYKKAGLSFIHNVISVLLVRIPGAYLASVYYPDTLYPMGWAPTMGSLLSVLLCVVFFYGIYKKEHNQADNPEQKTGL